MTQKEFMDFLVGLAKNKLEMFDSLSDECDCYWDQICDGQYDWQVHRNEALVLRSLTKDRVLEAFDKWFFPTTPNGNPRLRRMLVVQVVGSSDEASANDSIPRLIDNRVAAFHKSVGTGTWGKII
mmetsp:Transcript_18277/g.42305  ORF Transcript_18277/g.42305 Transcript_18277/m.42305 type:complete len:125 (-) Transcript_18277:348-722(-)